jgi:hypothetical protein
MGCTGRLVRHTDGVERDPASVKLIPWRQLRPRIVRGLIPLMLFWSVVAIVKNELALLWITLPVLLAGIAITAHYWRLAHSGRQRPSTIDTDD